MVTVPILWVIKDIALFPFVWRAYSFYDTTPVKELVGLEATVVYSLDPVGYVRVKGELWNAEMKDFPYTAAKGDRIRVVDIKGTKLIVEPIPTGHHPET